MLGFDEGDTELSSVGSTLDELEQFPQDLGQTSCRLEFEHLKRGALAAHEQKL